MPITINGSGTITGLSVDGLPAGTVGTATLTDLGVATGDIAASAVTPAKIAQPLTAMTPLSTASGTTASFTSIPSWVKRITIGISNFSNDGTNFVLALGYGATTYVATGYVGGYSRIESTGSSRGTFSTNFVVYPGPTSGGFHSGIITLVNTTGNTWAFAGNIAASTGSTNTVTAGHVDVTAVLTAIQFSGGTFDSGTISVMYE